MAYRLEQNGDNTDIVIDGWESGIADSPFGGINLLKNANTDVVGEVSVNQKTIALNKPPTVSALAFTVVASTNVFTVSSTSGWYNGMAIQFNTIVTSTNFSTGRVYWIGDLSGNTFKIYESPPVSGSIAVDIQTGDGSGTLSSYTFGKPISYTSGKSTSRLYWYYFILDENGLAWWLYNAGGTVTNNLVYMGNDTLANTGSNKGRGIAIFKNHLLVFRSNLVDGIGLTTIENNEDFDSAYTNSSSGGWEYGFTSANATGSDPRNVILGQDDILYWDSGGDEIQSLSETAGDTFELDDGASFTKNNSALDLPQEERDVQLKFTEIGTNLLIAGNTGKIYPWDRISSSYNFPIILPEKTINQIVTAKQTSYIFAGVRGNIYVTNGSSVDLFKKIPDYLSGTSKSIFITSNATITRNKLLFDLSIRNNGNTEINELDGVYSIDLSTGAFKLENELSHATQGRVLTLSPNPLDEYSGNGFIAGWQDASNNYGVDVCSTDPYSNGETIIDSDIIPIGTHLEKETPSHIEFKLCKPLVSGESIELQYAPNLNNSFTTIGTSNTVGAISEKFDTTFENVEWIKIRAILTSTDTNPSYVPLREVRIRL